MHAIVRSYSGSGARDLFGVLEDRKDEVESLIRAVPGFIGYTLIRTDDGGTSITVCQDKAGTDESLRLARNWIAENAGDLSVDPPSISEGPAILQLS